MTDILTVHHKCLSYDVHYKGMWSDSVEECLLEVGWIMIWSTGTIANMISTKSKGRPAIIIRVIKGAVGAESLNLETHYLNIYFVHDSC